MVGVSRFSLGDYDGGLIGSLMLCIDSKRRCIGVGVAVAVRLLFKGPLRTAKPTILGTGTVETGTAMCCGKSGVLTKATGKNTSYTIVGLLRSIGARGAMKRHVITFRHLNTMIFHQSSALDFENLLCCCVAEQQFHRLNLASQPNRLGGLV
ncbi:MAG: hypothetical protein WC325_10185 [Candidatus Bathyarchaeia archaeon]